MKPVFWVAHVAQKLGRETREGDKTAPSVVTEHRGAAVLCHNAWYVVYVVISIIWIGGRRNS
jgi:hypothetical protein